MPRSKRQPGSGCEATEPGAETGNMAILGHSPFCVATHPSDMAVTLTTLGARVQVAGPHGRWVAGEAAAPRVTQVRT
jgi:xanthine dehydrogenase YagS FAD-binding subunit